MRKLMVFSLLVLSLGLAARRTVIAEKFTNTG